MAEAEARDQVHSRWQDTAALEHLRQSLAGGAEASCSSSSSSTRGPSLRAEVAFYQAVRAEAQPFSADTCTGRWLLKDNELGQGCRVERFVNRGAYGSVWVVSDADGTVLAVKKCVDLDDGRQSRRVMIRELQILRMLQHPNLVRAVKVFPLPTASASSSSAIQCLSVGFELVPITLSRFLASAAQYGLADDDVRSLMHQLLCGVHYMHSAGVAHRDLKSANILLGPGLVLKLCDFGAARRMPLSQQPVPCDASSSPADATSTAPPPPPPPPPPPRHGRRLTAHVTTRWYRAPEVIQGTSSYTTAIDLWACGTILGEVLAAQARRPRAQQMLFRGDYCEPLSPCCPCCPWPDGQVDQRDAIARVLGKKAAGQAAETGVEFRSLFPSAPAQAIDLLERLLQWNPQARFTAAQALAHPFFADLSPKHVLSYTGLPIVDPTDGPLDVASLTTLLREEITQWR
jgi:mitogen-activated protein kinase 1/3